MGGVTKKVSQELGLSKKPTPSPTLNKMINEEVAKMSPSSSGDSQAEDRAARRRARRGGRALLSEQRLNAEQGVQTLGQAEM